MSPTRTSGRFVAALFALPLMVAAAAFAGGHKPQTLTLDLASPYDDVVKAVGEVAANGTVSGSGEYEKDSSIKGAQAGDYGQPFGAWSGPGQALYKTRVGALSPSHFVDSNDSGAVTVRYIVQSVNAGSTRVTIDAVFVESARHRWHPSDGSVETAEFAQIQQRLRFQEEQKRAAKMREEAEELDRMQQLANDEKRELDGLLADVAGLEQRAQGLRRERLARVKSVSQLKAAPFSTADPLRTLPQGEVVHVLISTAHWCQVRDNQGREGWVSHPALEAVP